MNNKNVSIEKEFKFTMKQFINTLKYLDYFIYFTLHFIFTKAVIRRSH